MLDLILPLTGVAGLIAVNLFFFAGKGKTRSAEQKGAYQEVRIRVQGGYDPNVVRVRAHIPVRIVFDRRENDPCTEKVIIRDLQMVADLPAFKKTVLQFTPDHAGSFEFSCHLGKVHARLIVENEATLRLSSEPASHSCDAIHQVNLHIRGMHCASCVINVENALQEVPGVISATVSLPLEKAVVTVQGGRDRIPELLRAVSDAGYSAIVENEEPAEDSPLSARDREEQRIARDLLTRFLVSALLSALVVLGALPHMLHGLIHWKPGLLHSPFLQFLLTTPVQFWAGYPFLRGMVSAFIRRWADMNTLIGMGTLSAYLYSTVVTFFPALVPENLRYVYYDGSAVIITLILLGRYLEARARKRSTSALRKLMGFQAKSAHRLVNGHEQEVPIADIRPGDTLVVRPGERIPADGEVMDGWSAVDESLVTGEFIPVDKSPGAKVIGGTLNQSGALIIRATRVGKDTLLAHIIKTVEIAQASKAPIQRLVDVVAGSFVPAVINIALMAFIAWSLWGPEPRFNYAFVTFISVLIIACPCALGLATPISIIVGTSKGAELGILIRDAEALEIAHRVRTIVFDKTGTLTEGKPRVAQIVVPPSTLPALSDETASHAENEVLRWAAIAERRSEHPLARAIVAEASSRGLSLDEPSHFEAFPGKGVRATSHRATIWVGSPEFLNEIGAETSSLQKIAQPLYENGMTVIYVARQDDPQSLPPRAVGAIGITDTLKPGASETISALKRMGVKVVMLTGDNRRTALAVARVIGISDVLAEVLPDQKADTIRSLQSAGATDGRSPSGLVAMVGDGINDAPALAQADLGIAMGSGADIAMETAGITILHGDIRKVPIALALSRATIRNIRQNLFWAFLYNVLGIPLAAGVFYRFIGDLLNPMIAALAMALSSVSVVTNANRLRYFQPR
ncbi:MAG: heavy metal translocating P-type ATPase [bacterium JZ-2024 1]